MTRTMAPRRFIGVKTDRGELAETGLGATVLGSGRDRPPAAATLSCVSGAVATLRCYLATTFRASMCSSRLAKAASGITPTGAAPEMTADADSVSTATAKLLM